MIAYLSTKSLCENGEPILHKSYSELVESVKGNLMWNGYYFDVRVLSEDELAEIAGTPAPKGCTRLDADKQDLYNLNIIRDYVREKIDPTWKKVKFLVGMHRERRYSRNIPPPGFWTEIFWTVEGVTYVV